jgi:farnesyl diphosphate synthase
MDIVTYKTAFYSFYLPVACGMHLADVANEVSLGVAKKILIKMGQYFQIQDDYLDCFADASVLGKIGTDIQDNKCSWLICQALQSASPTQRALIAENYGKDDDTCVQKIKTVYKCVSNHHLLPCPKPCACLSSATIENRRG